MTNKEQKEKYAEFAEQEQIPIFSQPYWLNAVAGDNWEVAITEKDKKITASLPYFPKKSKGITTLEQPALTQKLGVYIKYPPKQKYATKLKYEKEIIFKIIEKLPKFDIFKQNFDYTITNILPFHWKKFETKVRYTYLIETQSYTVDELLKNIDAKSRNMLKKASNYEVKEIDDIKKVYELSQSRFNRTNKTIPYSFNILEALYQELNKRKQCKILAAFEGEEIKAISFFVWDKISVYYLMGGVADGNKGGMNLLIWEGIKLAHSLGLNFDFEGSMNENIEKFFRSFGAKQKTLIYVYKIATKKAKYINCIKKLA